MAKNVFTVKIGKKAKGYRESFKNHPGHKSCQKRQQNKADCDNFYIFRLNQNKPLVLYPVLILKFFYKINRKFKAQPFLTENRDSITSPCKSQNLTYSVKNLKAYFFQPKVFLSFLPAIVPEYGFLASWVFLRLKKLEKTFALP